MEYRGFTTCRVGVHVSCLARRVQRTSRLYYAGQMSRQLNAPVRIAELAISGASVDASGRRHPHPAWRGDRLALHVEWSCGCEEGQSLLTTTQLPGQA